MGFMDGFLRKKTSGNTAKDRLKLVLVSDRANCSAGNDGINKKRHNKSDFEVHGD